MAHFQKYIILLAIVIYNAYIFNNVSAEVQHCNEVLLRNELIKVSNIEYYKFNYMYISHPDKKFKALWKNIKKLPISYFEDNANLHEVVHRYFKYLQSFNKYDNKILKPSIWCDKVKFLCLETLRMAGFNSDLFVPTKNIREATYENINKAKNMNEADIPSGMIGDYVRYVRSRSTDAFPFSMSTGKWCNDRCKINMQTHGFGSDIQLSLKDKVKQLKKNEIEKLTGCAKAFTEYYLFESKNNANCFNCKEDIPSTIMYWCAYQCV